MQSAEERRRLLSRLGSESVTPLWAVLKCAAGILVLVIVAAGPWLVLTAGSLNSYGQAATRDVPQAGTVIPASLAESKRVFDERRQHYEDVRQSNVQAVNSAGDAPLARE